MEQFNKYQRNCFNGHFFIRINNSLFTSYALYGYLIHNVTPDSISVIFFTGSINSSLATELYIDDITLEYTPNPVGIESYSDFQFAVFPNPSSNYLTIVPSDLNLPYSVSLIDMNGKIILREDNIMHKKSLPVSGFSKGLYIVKVIQANNVAIKKIVIE
jgi:hypothetical protein